MVAIPGAIHWTVLIAGDLTEGRFAVIESRERQGSEPPRHVHSREDEFIYVLEGQLSVERDDDHFTVQPGMWLYLPRGSQHRYKVESTDARMLVMLAPAGIEDWLRDLRLPDRAITEPGTVERLVSTAAHYGVEITGP